VLQRNTMHSMTTSAYQPRREFRSATHTVRGLRYHVRHWGDASLVTPDRPPLLMLHGWMDMGASFQFAVDAMDALEGPQRHIIAPDWRGFGLTESPACDHYAFPDYLGDLDTLLDQLLAPYPAGQRIDLLGHSMGGNVVMIYAGVRPERIRKLINLEGFGQPATVPAMAPKRYVNWLNELKEPAALHGYDDVGAVAKRLRKNNPLLREDRADWLAAHWAQPDASGRWHILGDPAHKRSGPTLYHRDDALACWAGITAPLLWVEGDQTNLARWWGTRYSKAEFHERLQVVPQRETHVLSPAGHMLHHDQPEALAERLLAFLAQ
jgi:pimeloyl-ACP methyl ester carboxylesterase